MIVILDEFNFPKEVDSKDEAATATWLKAKIASLQQSVYDKANSQLTLYFDDTLDNSLRTAVVGFETALGFKVNSILMHFVSIKRANIP